MKRKVRRYAADFETTVYKGQERTDVWSSAFSELFSETEEVTIHHTIKETYDYFSNMKEDVIAYYHNLKFDGAFWLDFLMNEMGYTTALSEVQCGEKKAEKWIDNKNMNPKTLKCSISSMGQWYTITIKTNKNVIELRDSLKLLPFTLARIGKSFKLKHQKLEMEYDGFRFPGCDITDEEKAYIANDVLVLREALEFMFSEGHDKLTIGACCLSEFVNGFGKEDYDSIFPDIYKIPIDESYGSPNAGEYVRKSYRGGWCYVVKAKRNEIKTNGTTADVNSLYPSMMSSESGNRFPVGRPTFYSMKNSSDEMKKWWLNRILWCANTMQQYYFVRFKTRFYLKHGKLPFIQIKNSFRFCGTDSLETSDYYDKKEGRYYTQWYKPDETGKPVLTDTAVTLTMTMIDLKLMLEHYDVVNFELLDFCCFNTEIGLFDDYMEKYKNIKQNSTGAMRELAKLFLNNLYGKMAASTDSSFKVPFIKPDGVIGLRDVEANDKKPGYIPIGSAITSYARNFTIRAAQQNYYGIDEPGFIYADTDSIHCDLPPEALKGIRVHPTDFCAWKLESCWDTAIFTRQKTYIEHITKENLEPIDSPYYNVKCAGMPESCKKLFIKGMENNEYQLTDFKIGLILPGKLMPRRIKGGILLCETTFEMR